MYRRFRNWRFMRLAGDDPVKQRIEWALRKSNTHIYLAAAEFFLLAVMAIATFDLYLLTRFGAGLSSVYSTWVPGYSIITPTHVDFSLVYFIAVVLVALWPMIVGLMVSEAFSRIPPHSFATIPHGVKRIAAFTSPYYWRLQFPVFASLGYLNALVVWLLLTIGGPWRIEFFFFSEVLCYLFLCLQVNMVLESIGETIILFNIPNQTVRKRVGYPFWRKVLPRLLHSTLIRSIVLLAVVMFLLDWFFPLNQPHRWAASLLPLYCFLGAFWLWTFIESFFLGRNIFSTMQLRRITHQQIEEMLFYYNQAGELPLED